MILTVFLDIGHPALGKLKEEVEEDSRVDWLLNETLSQKPIQKMLLGLGRWLGGLSAFPGSWRMEFLSPEPT